MPLYLPWSTILISTQYRYSFWYLFTSTIYSFHRSIYVSWLIYLLYRYKQAEKVCNFPYIIWLEMPLSNEESPYLSNQRNIILILQTKNKQTDEVLCPLSGKYLFCQLLIHRGEPERLTQFDLELVKGIQNTASTLSVFWEISYILNSFANIGVV